MTVDNEPRATPSRVNIIAKDVAPGRARFSDQRDLDLAARIEGGSERVDGEKAIGLRERRHRARALSGRKGDESVVAIHGRRRKASN